MNRIQNLAKLVGFAVFACSMLGFGSTAKAELTICNQHPTQLIWYTNIITDTTCGQAKRHEGWATINPNQCHTVFSGSMAGKTLQTFAISNNGVAVWQGPVQNARMTPQTNFSGCLANVTAFCTNPGAPSCPQRRYSTPFTHSTASVTVSFNPI